MDILSTQHSSLSQVNSILLSLMIENAIRSSRSLDDKVYNLLDKMEGLQQTRTTRWEQRMRNLAGEREEIARLLVKTLEMIEHETGIFLIKPIMSVPSRYDKRTNMNNIMNMI